MDIEKFIEKYDINKIKKLEQNDPQFLALQKSREKISNKNSALFLFLIIQCSLISYQIS
jgi:N-glycosylase/DNA lyase